MSEEAITKGRDKGRGIAQMLLCAFMWSTGGLLMKWLPWNGFSVASIRAAWAGVTILIYMLLTQKHFIVKKKTVVGALFTAAVYLCFASANKMTTAANAIVLQFTNPVFLVIFGILGGRQKPRIRDVVTVAVTLGGIALVFADQMEGGHLRGNLVALLSGFMMAVMIQTVGNLNEEERFSMILMGQWFTFIAGLSSVIRTRPVLNAVTLPTVAALGILQIGIAYILFLKASRRCPPLALSLLGGLEPLLNPVWVMLFDGETPGMLALIGGLIVLAAVSAWCVLDARETKS